MCGGGTLGSILGVAAGITAGVMTGGVGFAGMAAMGGLGLGIGGIVGADIEESTKGSPKGFDLPESLMPTLEMPELNLDIPDILTPEMETAMMQKEEKNTRLKRLQTSTGFDDLILTSPMNLGQKQTLGA